MTSPQHFLALRPCIELLTVGSDGRLIPAASASLAGSARNLAVGGLGLLGWVNTLKSDLGRPPIRPHFSYSSQAEALLSTCCTKALTMKTNQAYRTSLHNLQTQLQVRRIRQPPDKDGLPKIGSDGCFLEIPVTSEANTLDPFNQGHPLQNCQYLHQTPQQK